MTSFCRKLSAVVLASVVGIVLLSNQKEYPVFKHGAIVITGASSGIGRHAALSLDALGFRVYGTVRKESDAMSLRDERPSIRPVLLEIRNEKSVNKAAAGILAELEEDDMPLVGLVNNAGVSRRLPMELENMASVRKTYEVNVFGVWHATRAFLAALRDAGGGRIVNIGSTAGLIATPGSSVYSGTKFALEAMTDAMRVELMPWNISVSIVEPGYVKTKIASKQTGKHANHFEADQSKLHLYDDFIKKFEKKRLENEAIASDASVTSDAIIDALTNPRPRTRYVVAVAGKWSASTVAWLAYFLPDRLQDEIVLRFMK